MGAGPEVRPGPAAPTRFALGLGANLPGIGGASLRETLTTAVAHLEWILGPLAVAPLYRSRPLSPIAQPDYLNSAVVGHTALPPDGLLAVTKALELHLGRRPGGPRFGPRALDVDLLLYGTVESLRPELTLPHPRLRERRFVLLPLAEVAGDWTVPPSGESIRGLLHRLPDDGSVEAVGAWPWPPLIAG
jgi:2-amino-4-hydroxy-6-hydroxymethyldihydropteridine diphosphokinase